MVKPWKGRRFKWKSFVPWVLIIALVTWVVTGVVVYCAIGEPGWAGPILGTALGAWAFVLVCTVAFVGRAVILGLFPPEADGNGDAHTGEVERLKGIVLSAGVAAGLGSGLVVFYHGWKLVQDKTDLFAIITASIGPAAASGILLAVLVATGAIVFIFEEKLGGYTRSIIKAEGSLDDAATGIEKGVTINQDAVVTLSNLVNSLKGVDNLQSSELKTISAEAWYLNACFAAMHSSEKSSQTAGIEPALQSIFQAYWYEEASDITRHSIVTNARNYTSFLIAAVEALKPKAAEDGKLHFYTTTPAGPHSLLNWPDWEIARDTARKTFHRERDFISAYMLFIRELVLQEAERIVHRRWIWFKPQEPDGAQDYTGVEMFASWGHYEGSVDGSRYRVVGVPIPVRLFAEHQERLEELQLHSCSGCACTRDVDVRDQIVKWRNYEDDVALVPITAFTTRRGPWDELVNGAKAVFIEHIRSAADVLLEEIGNFESLPTKFSAWLEGWAQTAHESKGDFHADNLLPRLQELEAALMVSCRGAQARGKVSDALRMISRNLVRLRWVQIWQQTYPKDDLPTLNEYCETAFHTDHAVGRVFPKTLGECEALKKEPPEFAILGVESEVAPSGDERKHTLELGNGRWVYWQLALKSTISSPWIAGQMEIVTPASDKFERLCKGIDHLHKKDNAQRA